MLRVSDLLSDVNDVLLKDHVVSPLNTPGGLWRDVWMETQATPSWIIEGNAVQSFHGGFSGVCVKECGSPNGNLSVQVILPASGWIGGWVLRYVDPQNFYFVWLRQDTGTVQLWKHKAGGNGPGPLAEASATMPPGATVNLSASLSGNTISVSVGGGTLSKTDPDFSASSLNGFMDYIGGGASQLRFKNFNFDDGTSPGGGNTSGSYQWIREACFGGRA